MKYILCALLFSTTTIVNSQNFDIYVSDAGNFSSPPWQILKFDQNGQNPVLFINNNLNWPQDILFIEDSNLVLISNLGSGRITRHNATTGAFVSDFATGISGPTRMKIGADGYLYVLQWSGNGKVRRYNLDGSFVDEFTSIGVPQSIGIDWDSNGNLYISSYSGDLVRKFDTNGGDMGVFAGTNLLGPTNIWFDMNGDLLVADYNGTAVKRFDTSGNFTGNFMTGLIQCEGVGFLPNGNILIGNGGTQSVKMFDSNGTYIQDFIPSGSGNLMNPNAVIIRQLPGVSVPEYGTQQATVLYPSTGTEFYISQTYLNRLDMIHFYNMEGKLLKTILVPEQNMAIKSGDVPEGIYVVKISLKSGNEIVQKLIVTN